MHVPFCAVRCDYCEFYSVPLGAAGDAAPPCRSRPGRRARRRGARRRRRRTARRLLDRFVAALRAEWERERARFGVRGLETVFVGGGTPSLLGRERLERLFEPLEPLLTPRAEITLETNPDDVSDDFAAWAAERRLRVSLGVQSFDARLRAALGRHAAADPETAFAALRRAGVGAAVASVPDAGVRGAPRGAPPPPRGARSARPGHRPHLRPAGAAPERRRGRACRRGPPAARPRLVVRARHRVGQRPRGARHALAGRRARRGPRARRELPDDEAVAEMFRRIVAGLGRLGYEWYEVSNFAQPGRRCCHNSAVWRGHDYLGIGPGAVGTVAGERRRDVPDVAAWLEALEGGAEPPRELEVLDDATRARERLLLGARTGERVPLADLAGVIDESALPALAGAGLVSLTGGTLRVTRKGRYVANGVCVRLFRDSSFLEA